MSSLPPECQQLLVSGYVLGNLSPAEALLFEEMLGENPDLIEEVRAMQQALDVTYTPAEVPPPTHLRDRILTAANSQRSPSETVTSSSNGKPSVSSAKFGLFGGRILGAIALAIIAALGIANYYLWQTLQTAKKEDIQNPQSDRLTYVLGAKDSDTEPMAELVVDPDRLSANLTADNLPPLSSDRVYALWTVVGKEVPYTTDKKGAILTAVFQVDESGNFSQEIAVPQPFLEPRTVNKIAITVEDISAPQNHEGSIFISTE